MTHRADGTTLDVLVEAIHGAMPKLSADEQRLAGAIYRSLAEGRPATAAALASATRLPRREIERRLGSWPGIYRDGSGAIVGFWGLALPEMPHRLSIGGVDLHAWCAWDPLFIVPLLGETGRVRSTDPVTGREIGLIVSPEGVEALDPSETLVSFLAPEETWDDSVIESFCHFVHYFAGRDSGRAWCAEHAGTFLLSVDEALEIGRRINERHFPDIVTVAA